MRKTLMYILASLLIVGSVQAYEIAGGDTLSIIADKFGTTVTNLVNINNIKNPDLIYTGDEIDIGNNYLVEIYDNNVESFLGATPKRPTEYKTNLGEQKTEGHSDTTLKVTSITTKDDNELATSVLGDLIVLSINPGASNSEIVSCTGLTTSTKTFTGCTFGYRFDNPTATSSDNIKAHSPGEPVIISNTVTYLSQQYLTLDGDHTIAGANTVSGLWDYTNTKGLCFNGTSYCIRSSGTNLQWSLDGFTNSYNFTSTTFSVLTASSTRGIGVTDSKIYINASTTQGIEAKSDGSLGVDYNTNFLYADSNGLSIRGDMEPTWTAQHTFQATTTMATTTITDLAVSGSSTLSIVEATTLYVGGTSTASLVEGNSTTLHYHTVDTPTASTTMAFAQNYQNNSNHSIMVIATVYLGVSSQSATTTVTVLMDATATPSTVIAVASAYGGTSGGYFETRNEIPITFIVPPYNYFRLDAGGDATQWKNYIEYEL